MCKCLARVIRKLLAYLMGPTCEVYSLKEISVLRSFRTVQNRAGTAKSLELARVRVGREWQLSQGPKTPGLPL